MAMVIVTATTYLGGPLTSWKTRVRCPDNGQQHLLIRRRLMNAAINRCRVSSSDFLILTKVPGYSAWCEQRDGSWVCYKES